MLPSSPGGPWSSAERTSRSSLCLCWRPDPGLVPVVCWTVECAGATQASAALAGWGSPVPAPRTLQQARADLLLEALVERGMPRDRSQAALTLSVSSSFLVWGLLFSLLFSFFFSLLFSFFLLF